MSVPIRELPMWEWFTEEEEEVLLRSCSGDELRFVNGLLRRDSLPGRLVRYRRKFSNDLFEDTRKEMRAAIREAIHRVEMVIV